GGDAVDPVQQRLEALLGGAVAVGQLVADVGGGGVEVGLGHDRPNPAGVLEGGRGQQFAGEQEPARQSASDRTGKPDAGPAGRYEPPLQVAVADQRGVGGDDDIAGQ